VRGHHAVAGAIVAATLLLAVSACGGSGGGKSAPGGASTSTAVTSTLASAVDGLCLARSQVAGDPTAVRGTFYDRSHAAIHTIARELEPVDRALAARLLEAKEAVEVDVNAQPLGASSAADLDHLVDIARQGLARLSVPVGACR